jgi:hypothetical protein
VDAIVAAGISRKRMTSGGFELNRRVSKGRQTMNARYWSITGCALGAIALAAAADFPEHKPGLWEMTINMSGPGMGPMTERICLDADTDHLLYKFAAGMNQKMCSKMDVHGSGGKVVVDTVCHIANTTATGHSVTSFVGNTATHTESRVHYEPAMFGRTDSNSTQDGKWLGACPADMKPGDILMSSPRLPQPMKMNLNDMLKRAQ